MEGEELVDIVCILKEGLGVHIYIPEEGGDDVLELLARPPTDTLLHDTDDFVVVFHPQHQLAHPHHPVLIRLLLELLDHSQDVLSMLRKLQRRLEGVSELDQLQQEYNIGTAIPHEVYQMGIYL